jgi:hypothetical protein
MKSELKRRDFLATCFMAGIGCCALMTGTSVFAQDNKKQNTKPDPKKMNYCGYVCSNECTLYKATIENNAELKKKAYDDSKMKEKFNIDFDPDKIFCWGCKINDKPLSINVKACTVRKCAIEKTYDSCIQCNGLKACDKELWKNFPKFKDYVVGLQEKYLN